VALNYILDSGNLCGYPLELARSTPSLRSVIIGLKVVEDMAGARADRPLILAEADIQVTQSASAASSLNTCCD
jgi:hypothetical protein